MTKVVTTMIFPTTALGDKVEVPAIVFWDPKRMIQMIATSTVQKFIGIRNLKIGFSIVSTEMIGTTIGKINTQGIGNTEM
jgi:hypothetical protein